MTTENTPAAAPIEAPVADITPADIWKDEVADTSEAESAAIVAEESASVEEEEVKTEPVKEEVKPEKHVPLGALHEERARRKQAQAELQAVKEKLDKYDASLQAYQAKQNAPKVPDYEEDPLGHIKHQQDQLLQKQQQEDEQRKHQETQTQAQRKQLADLDNFLGEYKQAVSEYEEAQPEVMKAYDFLIEDRAAEYQAIGLTKAQAYQEVHKEEVRIASQAFSQGKNPAEVMYNLAVRRGYKAAEVAPPVPPINKDLDKIKTVKAGVAESKTIAGAAKTKSSSLTADELFDKITDPDDTESDKFWDNMVKTGKL